MGEKLGDQDIYKFQRMMLYGKIFLNYFYSYTLNCQFALLELCLDFHANASKLPTQAKFKQCATERSYANKV